MNKKILKKQAELFLDNPRASWMRYNEFGKMFPAIFALQEDLYKYKKEMISPFFTSLAEKFTTLNPNYVLTLEQLHEKLSKIDQVKDDKTVALSDQELKSLSNIIANYEDYESLLTSKQLAWLKQETPTKKDLENLMFDMAAEQTSDSLAFFHEKISNDRNKSLSPFFDTDKNKYTRYTIKTDLEILFDEVNKNPQDKDLVKEVKTKLFEYYDNVVNFFETSLSNESRNILKDSDTGKQATEVLEKYHPVIKSYEKYFQDRQISI